MVESTLNLGGFLQHPLITSSLERASHTYAIISFFLGPYSVRTVDRPLPPHDRAKTLAWPCLSTFVNLDAADRLDFYNAIRAVQYTAIPFPPSPVFPAIPISRSSASTGSSPGWNSEFAKLVSEGNIQI